MMTGANSIYHPLAITPVADAFYINMIALAYLMRRDHLPPQCKDLTLERFGQFIQTCFLQSTGPFQSIAAARDAIDQLADALDVFARLAVN